MEQYMCTVYKKERVKIVVGGATSEMQKCIKKGENISKDMTCEKDFTRERDFIKVGGKGYICVLYPREYMPKCVDSHTRNMESIRGGGSGHCALEKCRLT